jgi:hypothetical protein
VANCQPIDVDSNSILIMRIVCLERQHSGLSELTHGARCAAAEPEQVLLIERLAHHLYIETFVAWERHDDLFRPFVVFLAHAAEPEKEKSQAFRPS